MNVEPLNGEDMPCDRTVQVDSRGTVEFQCPIAKRERCVLGTWQNERTTTLCNLR